MGRTADSYLKLLKSLLPRGKAWSRDSGTMPQLLLGMAQEMSRMDTVIDSLIQERDTRYTDALLDEHELDLFGAADITGATDAVRQAVLNAKIRETGGQVKQYFINMAAGFGCVITITEFRPAWCGVVVCGDPCGDQEVLFYWKVNVQYDRDTASETLDALQAKLELLKPAHTVMIFNIIGPEFSNAFRQADFNSMPPSDKTVGDFDRRDFNNEDFSVWFGGDFAREEFSEDFSKVC